MKQSGIKRPRIISISGLDGSGKSSQTEKLAAHYAKLGVRTYYFHATNFALLNLLKSRLRKVQPSQGDDSSAATSSSYLGILLRKVMLPVDMLRFRFLLRRLEKRGVDYILSDRYFYDTAINIAYLSGSSKLMRLRCIVLPDAAFYLRTDPAVIMSRARQPEQGLNYLVKKQTLYDEAIEQYSLHRIDGGQTQQEVSHDINKLLTKRGLHA